MAKEKMMSEGMIREEKKRKQIMPVIAIITAAKSTQHAFIYCDLHMTLRWN